MGTQLTELPIDCALSLAGSTLDRAHAIEMEQLEAELVRDNVCRDSIDGLLEHRREQFVLWRAQELTELRDWLMDCDRKLH